MPVGKIIVLRERTLEVYRQPDGLVSIGIGDGQEPIRMRSNEAARLVGAINTKLAGKPPEAAGERPVSAIADRDVSHARPDCHTYYRHPPARFSRLPRWWSS